MSETAETNVPTAEAATNEVAEAPKAVEVPSSNKFLDLAKKEAAFVKKEVEYKTRLAEAEKQLQELQYFRKAKETYKSNPEELLGKLGIGYDDLTNAIIEYYDNKEKGAKQPTIEELRKEIENEFLKREASKAESTAQETLVSFVGEIEDFVEKSADEYPHLTKLSNTLTKTETPGELIYDVVQEYFQETGEILDLKTAAETAEEYLRDEWNKLNGVLSNKPSTTTTPAPTEKGKENIVVSKSSAPNVEAEPVNVSKFKTRDLPTITNAMRPVSNIPYRNKSSERNDLIEKAVQTYENVARRSK
jgi:hypothetical protein